MPGISLPLKWRTEVYRRYPDLRERAESKEFVDTIEPDAKALDFFQSYKLADGRNLPYDKVLEYSSNAAVMNAFRRCWEAHVNKRQRTGKKAVAAKVFWTRAAAALPRLADLYPHSLPGSARRLQMKLQEYLQQGYACFISGKYMNGNAGKVLTDEQVGYLATLISDPNNVSDTIVAKFYNRAAKIYGWPEITAGTVAVRREKLNLEADAGRLGQTNFRNTRTMQVKRFRPTAPFLMCSLEGWTVELLYQKTRTDKKGHNVTTYTNRLTIVVVLDPCVDYPMGYAVGDHECPELIKEALRNAALHSKELTGRMLRYNQVQSDRYAIGKMTPLYAILGDKVTPAQAHNAKSKPVEPYFIHLNTTYCQLCRNWAGFGVTTDPKRQPNSEALNKYRHNFPDEAGVRAQIDEMMRLEREAKRPALMEKLANLKPEHTLPMSREMYLLNFGAETGFKNVLEGCGLRDMDEDWRSGDTALSGEISELSGEIEELRRIIDGASSAGVVEPVGTIKPWAGADTPGGGTWLECSSTQYDLQYSKSDYPELFGVLSDEYKTTQDKVLNGGYEDIVSEFSFRVPNIQGDDVKYFIKAKL